MVLGDAAYQFGPFRLDPAERLLTNYGQPVALTPKAFDLLVYLVERAWAPRRKVDAHDCPVARHHRRRGKPRLSDLGAAQSPRRQRGPHPDGADEGISIRWRSDARYGCALEIKTHAGHPDRSWRHDTDRGVDDGRLLAQAFKRRACTDVESAFGPSSAGDDAHRLAGLAIPVTGWQSGSVRVGRRSQRQPRYLCHARRLARCAAADDASRRGLCAKLVAERARNRIPKNRFRRHQLPGQTPRRLGTRWARPAYQRFPGVGDARLVAGFPLHRRRAHGRPRHGPRHLPRARLGRSGSPDRTIERAGGSARARVLTGRPQTGLRCAATPSTRKATVSMPSVDRRAVTSWSWTSTMPIVREGRRGL